MNDPFKTEINLPNNVLQTFNKNRREYHLWHFQTIKSKMAARVGTLEGFHIYYISLTNFKGMIRVFSLTQTLMKIRYYIAIFPTFPDTYMYDTERIYTIQLAVMFMYSQCASGSQALQNLR